MYDKPYTIDEIRRLIQPIAARHGVERVLLFGSYARGDANSDSDIDFRIDSGALRGYFKLAGFRRELEETLKRPVDVLTSGSLDSEFLTRISKDEVVIYE